MKSPAERLDDIATLRYQLAVALAATRDGRPEALEQINRALDVPGATPRWMLHEFKASLTDSDKERADELLEAVSLAPAETETIARELLGMVRAVPMQFDRAIVQRLGGRLSHPAPTWSSILLATLRAADHAYAEALAILERVGDPADGEARASMRAVRGDALLGLGRYDEARQLADDPSAFGDCHLAVVGAQAALACGQVEAVRGDAGDGACATELAPFEALARLHDDEEAARRCAEVGFGANAIAVRCIIALNDRDYDRATGELERLRAIDPAHACNDLLTIQVELERLGSGSGNLSADPAQVQRLVQHGPTGMWLAIQEATRAGDDRWAFARAAIAAVAGEDDALARLQALSTADTTYHQDFDAAFRTGELLESTDRNAAARAYAIGAALVDRLFDQRMLHAADYACRVDPSPQNVVTRSRVRTSRSYEIPTEEALAMLLADVDAWPDTLGDLDPAQTSAARGHLLVRICELKAGRDAPELVEALETLICSMLIDKDEPSPVGLLAVLCSGLLAEPALGLRAAVRAWETSSTWEWLSDSAANAYFTFAGRCEPADQFGLCSEGLRSVQSAIEAQYAGRFEDAAGLATLDDTPLVLAASRSHLGGDWTEIEPIIAAGLSKLDEPASADTIGANCTVLVALGRVGEAAELLTTIEGSMAQRFQVRIAQILVAMCRDPTRAPAVGAELCDYLRTHPVPRNVIDAGRVDLKLTHDRPGQDPAVKAELAGAIEVAVARFDQLTAAAGDDVYVGAGIAPLSLPNDSRAARLVELWRIEEEGGTLDEFLALVARIDEQFDAAPSLLVDLIRRAEQAVVERSSLGESEQSGLAAAVDVARRFPAPATASSLLAAMSRSGQLGPDPQLEAAVSGIPPAAFEMALSTVESADDMWRLRRQLAAAMSPDTFAVVCPMIDERIPSIADIRVTASLVSRAPLGLLLGTRLVPVDTSTTSWSLFTTCIPELRARLMEEVGLSMPGISVRPDPYTEDRVTLCIDEGVVATWRHPLAPGELPSDEQIAAIIRDYERQLRPHLARLVNEFVVEQVRQEGGLEPELPSEPEVREAWIGTLRSLVGAGDSIGGEAIGRAIEDAVNHGVRDGAEIAGRVRAAIGETTA